MTAPHFTAIAHFVRTLRDDIAQVVAAVLAVCDGQGLIGREMVAIDGVKLPSNASTHRSGGPGDAGAAPGSRYAGPRARCRGENHQVCQQRALHPEGLVLHADNGGPMKGATMVGTLERLGVIPSFSRPGVSDDNPYSEALFRTLKYCPAFPTQPFADVAAAERWVAAFVQWYNHDHQHSAIHFVTPDDRHTGCDIAILAHRDLVYRAAQAQHPERWSRGTRDWTRVTTVRLTPEQQPTEGAQPAFV